MLYALSEPPVQDRIVGLANWLLLIYTIPAEPSRKRAFVWRELKKVGAVYLRDGVYVLPETEETNRAFRAIADKVEELGGEATLIASVALEPRRAAAVRASAGEARAEEYQEIAREARAFLDHVQRETEHRDFGFAELEGLDVDVGKLKRWKDQVQARDYFGVEDSEAAEQLLRQCEEALAVFEDAVFREDDVSR